MTRRKLLLWGVPAVLGLAVVAGFTALVLIPPNEASRMRNKVEVGMTTEQVCDAIGKEIPVEVLIHIMGDSHSNGFFWHLDDGSELVLIFANGRLKKLEVLSSNPPWHQRIRDTLRDAGLPI